MQESDFLRYDPHVRRFGRMVMVYMVGIACALAIGGDWAHLWQGRPWLPYLALGVAPTAFVGIYMLLRGDSVAHAINLVRENRGNKASDNAYGAMVYGQQENTFTTVRARIFGLMLFAMTCASLYHVYMRLLKWPLKIVMPTMPWH